MWPFTPILVLLNFVPRLYHKWPVHVSWTLLAFLYCQFENWKVYLTGDPVSCKPFDWMPPWRLNEHCWEQFVDGEDAFVPQEFCRPGEMNEERRGTYIWLPYQFLGLGLCLILPFVNLRPGNGVNHLLETNVIAGLLTSVEELDMDLRPGKLKSIAEGFLYSRCRRNAALRIIPTIRSLVGYLAAFAATFSLRVPSVRLIRLVLSGGIPWSRVNPFEKSFPRFMNCSVAELTGEAGDPAVVSCELTLNRFNAVALICFWYLFILRAVWDTWEAALLICRCLFIYSTPDLRQRALDSLGVHNSDDDEYKKCSAAIAESCDANDMEFLMPLLERDDPFLAREFVHALGKEIIDIGKPPSGVLRNADGNANLYLIWEIVRLITVIGVIFLLGPYLAGYSFFLGICVAACSVIVPNAVGNWLSQAKDHRPASNNMRAKDS